METEAVGQSMTASDWLMQQRCIGIAGTRHNKTTVTPEVAQALSDAILSGMSVRAMATDPEGMKRQVHITSLRHLYRFLKPVSGPAQVRFFRSWHKRARRMADARAAILYVSAGEPVFCGYGHPIGEIRVNVPAKPIPASAVTAISPSKARVRWDQASPETCGWCGTHTVRAPDGGWFMAGAEPK